MTTLCDKALFEHLGELKKGVENIRSSQKKDELTYLAHSQLIEILDNEANFLEKFKNYAVPTLAFSGNGFPSPDSLKPDLEKMCELGEFNDIKDKYQNNYFLNKGHDEKYLNALKEINRKKWEKELKNLDKKKIKRKIRFGVTENYDKFGLGIREEIYLNNLDSFSTDFPLLMREVTNTYQVVFGRIFDKRKEEYYVLNKNLIFDKRRLQDEVKRVSNYEVTKSFVKDILNFTKRKIPRGIKHFSGCVYWRPTSSKHKDSLLHLLEQFGVGCFGGTIAHNFIYIPSMIGIRAALNPNFFERVNSSVNHELGIGGYLRLAGIFLPILTNSISFFCEAFKQRKKEIEWDLKNKK